MAGNSTDVQFNSPNLDANSSFGPEAYDQGISGNTMLSSTAGPSAWPPPISNEIPDGQLGQIYVCSEFGCGKEFDKLHKLRLVVSFGNILLHHCHMLGSPRKETKQEPTLGSTRRLTVPLSVAQLKPVVVS